MLATVHYIAIASFSIEVEIDDGTPEEEREDAAREKAEEHYGHKAPGPLCHQCSKEYELGEFEPQEGEEGVTFQ